ncbi:MAG: glycine betaine transporter [Woeseiaceae bacterium]
MEWIGAIVIGLVVSCLIYIFATKLNIVSNIKSSPAENNLDFDKVNAID